MKTFRIFSMAVLAIILAACSSNDEIIGQPEQPTGEVIHFSGTISTESAATRTQMTENGDGTISVDWKVNDVINLCQGDTKYGTAQVKSLSGTSAYIEGTLSGEYNLANDFDLIYLGNLEGTGLSDLSAIYANQKGNVANLGEYDCRKGSAKLKLDGSNYVIDGTVKLAAQMAIWKLTLTDSTNPLNMNQTADQLKVYYDGAIVAGAGTNFAGGSTNVVYLAVPTASSKTIRIEYTDGNFIYYYQKSGISITASKYYQSTVALNNVLPAGSLDGKFTINASGDQVRFSKGNLQYYCSTSAPEWRFADHQYDYVAFDGTAYAENSGKWIDLFAYGTSGYNNGQACYQPYSISGDASHYYQNALTGNADWGYNKISNGGNSYGIWRTLTSTEWRYLFQVRTDANNKYGHGSVNGIHGMIILPDEWTLPAGLTFTPGNSAWSNTYTIAEWAQMEAAGAVFLPASGSRAGDTLPTVAEANGLYRSSTNAYYVYFSSNSLSVCTNSDNYYQYGDAVRLVRDVSAATSKSLTSLTTNEIGWRLGSDGVAYSSTGALPAGVTAEAIIAYVGNVPNYFSHFIAIALVDVVPSTTYYYWADALGKVGDFAAAHPITIGSTPYNTSTTGSTYYDQVQGNKSVSSATATAAQTGWRLPSITDWRYIFEGFGGPKVSDQAGVNGGTEMSYGNGEALYNAINTACGNTALSRSNYWTSSEYAGNSDYVWYYGFWDGITDIGKKAQNQYQVRAVFAY